MQVKVEILSEVIENAMDAANIGYWASVPRGAEHAKVLAGKASAIVRELDGPHNGIGTGRHELTGAKVRQGLRVMAEKYPHHYADLISDNADCWTGDTLIQCALFGELVYG